MENVGGGGSIAMNLCIGIFCIMYLMLDRSMRKLTAIYLMIFILCGLYLLFSKGRIIALFVMMLVYGMFATSTARRRFARIILLAVGIMITIIISSSKIDAYMYKSSTADTLTGRTVLWARTYDQIRNGPSIRGFGLLSFQSIGPNTFSSLGYLSHAHNEFLNLWFNLGLVGVALAAGLYLALIFTSLKAIKSGIGPFAVLTLCVVVFCLVDGLTDASASMCVIPGQWFILFDCLVSTALAGAVRSTARHIVY